MKPVKTLRRLYRRKRIKKLDNHLLISHQMEIYKRCLTLMFLMDVTDKKKPWVTFNDFETYREEMLKRRHRLVGHTTVCQYIAFMMSTYDADLIYPLGRSKDVNSLELVTMYHSTLSAFYPIKEVKKPDFRKHVIFWQTADGPVNAIIDTLDACIDGLYKYAEVNAK